MLFADLCGFTSLSERLDPEEVRAFQSALFDSLGQAIARCGGFVAKYLGDAVLALFGAPVAHEDDPERALDAALDMLPRAERAEPDSGRRASASRSPCTSPSIPGRSSPAAWATAPARAYAVTGDTVNTASRLLGAAAPGTILVAGSTQALVSHRFAFEPAGELALRGKAEPMAVHRLRRRAAPSRGLPRGLADARPRRAAGRARRGARSPAGRLRPHAGGPRAGRQPGRRGRQRQVAADRRVPRPARGRSGRLAGTAVRRADLLVARRADLRRLRRAVPRSLRRRAGRSLEVARDKLARGPERARRRRRRLRRRSHRC